MMDPYDRNAPYRGIELDALGSMVGPDYKCEHVRMLTAFRSILHVDSIETAHKIARDMLDPARRAGPCAPKRGYGNDSS